MSLDKHIWEGWTAQDFINELAPLLEMIQGGRSWQPVITDKETLKRWCKDNQPYYKKHIPLVVNFFAKQYNLK